MIGLLQTEEDQYGKGFATIIVKEIAKQIASKNNDVTACVVLANNPSRALFEKLGFEAIDVCSWLTVVEKDNVA